MQKLEIGQILTEWSDEFTDSLCKTNTLCVALFNADKELLFATPVMHSLFKGEPYKSFINPKFEKLLEIKSTSSLVFEGLLTIGNYTSINSSIAAQVFFKEGRMLVIGGADTAQLLQQYTSMHHLNHQISNLQRQLLKEKSTLEKTLKQLNEANAVLQQLNITKDKFFSIIAHDLRGPFNGFLGLTKMMAEKLPNFTMVEIQKMAVSMQKSATNLYSLLGNLLDWSRIEQGLLNTKPESFLLLDELKATIESVGDAAGEKNIVINLVVPDTTMVLADMQMVKSLLRNLVFNAIKFTPEGGAIFITAKLIPGEFVEISVIDTGIGMNKDMLGKLFQLNMNISRKGTAGEPSTGLGLIICKDLVEKNGGKIWAESEEGKGSKFYFTVPGNVGQVEKLAGNDDLAEQVTNHDRKLKILIAEDDEVSEMLISINVSEFSNEVIKAVTGIEAVEICRNRPDIDLIMMDIQMPDMDGYEATRQIRLFNPDVIIIVQTAFGQSGSREKALAAGCNDYIAKPVEISLLMQIIKKHFMIS